MICAVKRVLFGVLCFVISYSLVISGVSLVQASPATICIPNRYSSTQPEVQAPEIEWSKTFGGTSSDFGHSVMQTADGDYIITGHTASYGGGDSDVWLIEFSPELTAESSWPMFKHDSQHTGQSPYVGPREAVSERLFELSGYYLGNAPAIGADGTIYLAARGALYAVNPDGVIEWYYSRYDYPPAIILGNTPTIHPNGIILLAEECLSAIDTEGNLVWYVPVRTLYTNIYPVLGSDGTIYYAGGVVVPDLGYWQCLIALDPEGTVLWLYNIESGLKIEKPDFSLAPDGLQGVSSPGPITTPVVSPDGTIYFTYKNTLCAVNRDGTEKWRLTIGDDTMKMSSPTVDDAGNVYVNPHVYNGVSGKLYSIDPFGHINWFSQASAGSIATSPVIGNDGTLYVCLSGGHLQAFDENGNPKWYVESGGRPEACDAESFVYTVWDRIIKAFDSEGNEIWQWLAPSHSGPSSISLDNRGILYAGTFEALYTLGVASEDVTAPAGVTALKTLNLTSSGFVYPTGEAPTRSPYLHYEYGEYDGISYYQYAGWLARGDMDGDNNGQLDYEPSSRYHIGQDIEANVGDNVYAITEGEIIYVSVSGWGEGNYGLLMKHKLGTSEEFLALYGHVIPKREELHYTESSHVDPAIPVHSGEAFATIGLYDSIPHLHFGIHPDTDIPTTYEDPDNPAKNIGLGRMGLDNWSDSDGPDSNGFVDPIAWITTHSPFYLINPISSIMLAWTAPGDDGNTGTASQYDIRYSTSEITDTSWDSATQCNDEPTPQPAGRSENFTVTGLLSNTIYFFAMKTADEVFNWSGLSNIVCGETTVSNQPPVASFTYSPYELTMYSERRPGVGEEIEFDASNSEDPEGGALSYEWDFGDGITYSDRIVRHTYTSQGVYSVTLTVTDDGNKVDTVTNNRVKVVPAWRKEIRVGDILFDPTSLGGIGHVGIYHGSGLTVEAQGDIWAGLEPGVVVDHIETWDIRAGAYLLRVNCTDEQRLKAADFAWDQLLKEYEFPYITKDINPGSTEWYCSELVWAAYKWQDIDLEFEPDDFAVSPLEIYTEAVNYPSKIAVVSHRGEEVDPTPDFELVVLLFCPVDIEVIDPDGFRVNKNSQGITASVYMIDDVNGDGIIDKCIALPERKTGDYLIRLTIESEALPQDTYSLQILSGEDTVLLADNIPITTISEQGCIVRSNSSGIKQIIPANIDFNPNTLNLRSKGKFITVYIELPQGYDVNQIDVLSILLNESVPAKTKPTEVGDYDNDGIPDLMVKFDRSAVQRILASGEQVEIIISGEVAGIVFEGSDTIRMIKN